MGEEGMPSGVSVDGSLKIHLELDMQVSESVPYMDHMSNVVEDQTTTTTTATTYQGALSVPVERFVSLSGRQEADHLQCSSE